MEVPIAYAEAVVALLRSSNPAERTALVWRFVLVMGAVAGTYALVHIFVHPR